MSKTIKEIKESILTKIAATVGADSDASIPALTSAKANEACAWATCYRTLAEAESIEKTKHSELA